MIRRALSFVFVVMGLVLAGCGPGPKPDSLVGEAEAARVTMAYLRAVEGGDFELAKRYLFAKADYVLADPKRCQELLFSIPSTSMQVQALDRQVYDGDWRISVDLKIGYGDKMKNLRFLLVAGSPPELRSVSPLGE